MMTLNEIGATASALGNQLGAGIPLDQALSRMGQLQPAYAEIWARAVQQIQNGERLSDALTGVWPDSLITALKAGEQSGSVDLVFRRIEETVELQLSLRGTLMRLAYPASTGLMGLGVFLGFMIYVIPLLAKSIGHNGNADPIFQFSAWLSAFVLSNYVTIGVVMGVAIAALVAWLKTPEARSMILDKLLMIPVVKTALRDMYFGLWANYMAMMVSAGIPTTAALRLTAPVLPGVLRESIDVFERDLSGNNLSMSDSADLAKLPPDDPRTRWWPFYIANAFIVANQTGEVDKELLRVAPALINEGVKKVNRAIAVANVVAMALSAALTVSPLAAYYTEIFAAIRNAGS